MKCVLMVIFAISGGLSHGQGYIVKDFIPPPTHIVREFIPPSVVVYSEPIRVVRQFAPTIVKQPSVAHWSYPGDITTHLQREHGQSAYGLSIEQQLTLHDSLHTSRIPATQSNCPGGVCPTNRTYSVPFRFFGR
jgi:hypothetical protein